MLNGALLQRQATCSASSSSVETRIAKRLGQAPGVCIIISNHSFLKQRSNFTFDHSNGAGKQLQVVTFLIYRNFIWQWLQIWAVVPTTGNAFSTVGVTWNKSKTQEVWLLNVSKYFPSQNILKKYLGLWRRHSLNVGNLWGTFPDRLSSHQAFPVVHAFSIPMCRHSQ